ncbi:MAG: helix-turn-helix transcriptional regulator [Saprospiraceae bacterium]|nr:helix-turn-helix transcriptional regulator [Saprospiraceae bacterium]
MNILKLKEVLQEKNITGKDLSVKLGVSQNTVSNIVNGYSFPKPSLLVDIAKELNVDLRDLFVSTKVRDLSDPASAIKEIKRIVDGVKV